MNLEILALKTKSMFGHVIAVGLTADIVNNTIFQDNYRSAAIEGIAVVYIEALRYFDRKKQKKINESPDKIYNERSPQLEK